MDCTCVEGCTKIAEAFHSMELGCFSVINAYLPGEISLLGTYDKQPAQFPHFQRVIDQKHQHHEEQAAD